MPHNRYIDNGADFCLVTYDSSSRSRFLVVFPCSVSRLFECRPVLRHTLICTRLRIGINPISANPAKRLQRDLFGDSFRHYLDAAAVRGHLSVCLVPPYCPAPTVARISSSASI